LKKDGSCVNGGSGKWHLPKRGKPGEWMPEIEGELELCANGYHICRPQDLIYWLDEAIFEVEFEGEIVEGYDKCVVRKARLVRKLETWNENTMRLFAADCAEHVLHHFEKEYPAQAARYYASKSEMVAAMVEAGDAARAAQTKWQADRLMEYLEE
jgi:hypothetical protein